MGEGSGTAAFGKAGGISRHCGAQLFPKRIEFEELTAASYCGVWNKNIGSGCAVLPYRHDLTGARLGASGSIRSVSDEGCHHREIWGREVFLFDAGNRPVWQIAPEPGATDDMHRNFDATRPATDTFSAISNIDGRFYASRIGGDTFVIDMTTGAASYSGWART